MSLLWLCVQCTARMEQKSSRLLLSWGEFTKSFGVWQHLAGAWAGAMNGRGPKVSPGAGLMGAFFHTDLGLASWYKLHLQDSSPFLLV